MCLRRAPEKCIAGAALDRAGLDNMGSSTSYNPVGFHGLLRGWIYFFLLFLFSTEDGGHIYLRDVRFPSADYALFYLRR
jgi:hypothetical protein